MKLTIATVAIYVIIVLLSQQPDAAVGNIVDLPPEFLNEPSSNILDVGAEPTVLDKGHMEFDGGRKSHHCSVEVGMRIPGKCKYLGRAGVACMAGDYVDLMNKDCMM